MKLRELNASFMTRESNGVITCHEVFAEAQGLRFLCPKCWLENKGPVGTHEVWCWFRGRVPDDLSPTPGRWTPQGSGLDDLTFVPGVPPIACSVLLTGGCGWHGFIEGGALRTA